MGAPAPPGSPAGVVRWRGCAGHRGWQCATLSVPLDWARPGRLITLALTRHRATDASHRLGSLVLNPGGPGASGIGFAYDAVANLLDPVLVRSFDVVGFDPRGVGESTPVICTDGPTLDRINHVDPVLDTPAKLAAGLAAARELAAACQARSGWLLPFLSTRDQARDLDAIRAALGDATLTYAGFSYGTLLGAQYATLFPTHVRALALDGAEDPAVGSLAVDAAQASGFEHELDAFLADCAAQGGGCPFRAAGAPTLRGAFDALVARIRARPLRAGHGRVLGPGEALFGVAWPLYLQATWPDLAAALAAAQNGDGGPLLQQFDGYIGRDAHGAYTNEEVANSAISCIDAPPPTVAAMQAAEPALAAASPYFGPPLAFQDLTCSVWPVAPTAPVGPLHATGAPPILVVGSTGDPATPYTWAQGLASEVGSGVLLTRHGNGHSAYPASACARAAIDRYLTDLTVPTGAAADCAA